MTLELKLLTLSILIGLVQIVLVLLRHKFNRTGRAVEA